VDSTQRNPQVGCEDLVQLGPVEIPAGVLREGGVALSDLVTQFRPLHFDNRFLALPRTGWRIVHDRRASAEQPIRQVLLAAPSGRDPNAWVTVGLTQRDGPWSARIDPTPVTARPGKATRRKGLRLTWGEEPMIGLTGRPLSLQVGLLNASSQVWTNGDANADRWGYDDLSVVVWLLAPDGTALPANDRFAPAGDRPLIRIGPGEIVMLPARIATTHVQKLPAGDYPLTAVLRSVELESDRGRLRLLPPDAAGRATYESNEGPRPGW
jgi:hypothetical protein